MADERGFLGRWSRRKGAARVVGAPEPGLAEPGLPGALPEPVPEVELPAIESLGAGSDYSAFLLRGVAAVVQRQALQKAWTTDAAISGFRGMADYDWDFNAPGYGALRVGDDVARLIRAVMSPALGEAPVGEVGSGGVGLGEVVRVSAVEPPAEESATVDEGVDVIPDLEAPVSVLEEEELVPVVRRHGSARPV